MKTLRQSLIDYELPLLQAIAARWAIQTSDSISKTKIVDLLIDTLQSPVTIAIFLDDLSTPAQQALDFLLVNGGQAERARFARQFGTIRPMGPARLAREEPWLSPVNPAEDLWYRGIIFKAFTVTPQGSEEFVYISSDILPLISQDVPLPNRSSIPELSAAAPEHLVESDERLRENFFNLLVYLQTHVVKLQPQEDAPGPQEQQALVECLLPVPSWLSPAEELDFLLHLGQRANLLSVAHRRLKPNRDPVKQWLQSDATQQVWLLQNTWRADPTWNDLWRVPELVPQPTGWENSPLRARAAILSQLEAADDLADGWIGIAPFVAMIKRLDPDFQRPGGDYQSWYIQDQAGNSLMGFAHWDTIEGGLIRYLLTQVLLMLGAVDVGFNSDQQPVSFRMTLAGSSFLKGQPMLPQPSPRSVLLRLNDKFQVSVPAKASLYDRFQLARFAQLEERRPTRVIYRITQRSFNRALKNGVTADQITAFLTRVTGNQIPLRVVETMRTWGTRLGTAKLEQATLLRLETEQAAVAIRRHPALQPLLGQTIGPTTILVPAQNIVKVRQLLIQLGYLEQEQ